MFGLGPATKIFLSVAAVDMRNYVPFIVMRSCAVPSAELARLRNAGRRITRATWSEALPATCLADGSGHDAQLVEAPTPLLRVFRWDPL